jgi:hypothetical protein
LHLIFQNLSRLVHYRLFFLSWKREAKTYFGRTFSPLLDLVEQLFAVTRRHHPSRAPSSRQGARQLKAAKRYNSKNQRL